MWSSPARACNYFMPRVFEILRDEVCHGIRGLRAVTKQALRAPSLHTSPGIRRHRNDGGTNANTIPKTLSPTPTTRYETDTLAAEPIRYEIAKRFVQVARFRVPENTVNGIIIAIHALTRFSDWRSFFSVHYVDYLHSRDFVIFAHGNQCCIGPICRPITAL